MLTTIYFPVPKLDGMKFDYHGRISGDDIDRLLEVMPSERHVNYDVRRKVTEGDEMRPLQAAVEGKNGSPVCQADFERFLTDPNLKAVELNVNPTTEDFDTISELRLWIGDSEKVLKDRDLDKRTKILALPVRRIIVSVEGVDYNLNDCRMIGKLVGKYPLHFIAMFRNITKG